MAWPVLVFDIESIPDLAGLRSLRDDPPEWSDDQVYEAWVKERAEKGQGDFMPLHLQRVLAHLPLRPQPLRLRRTHVARRV